MAYELDLKHLARLGAIVRLNELLEERACIFKVFPDLKRSVLAPRQSPVGRRKKGPSSPEVREAISDGMRRYWARRKAKPSPAATK
ncbi:MAG: hypothetical protein IPL75_04800 [Acidobacteria bacterium]|jgi:hypothetical protein|nr:hypothetical protein [Acidobacteriota bacterium]